MPDVVPLRARVCAFAPVVWPYVPRTRAPPLGPSGWRGIWGGERKRAPYLVDGRKGTISHPTPSRTPVPAHRSSVNYWLSPDPTDHTCAAAEARRFSASHRRTDASWPQPDTYTVLKRDPCRHISGGRCRPASRQHSSTPDATRLGRSLPVGGHCHPRDAPSTQICALTYVSTRVWARPSIVAPPSRWR